MISIGGFTFIGHAGTLSRGPADQPLQLMAAPGAYGSSLLVGPIRGREITIPYWLDGIPSKAALSAIFDQYALRQGLLTGTLVKDGPDAESIGNCIFIRFEPEGEPLYSPGGSTYGWIQFGLLRFHQLRI